MRRLNHISRVMAYYKTISIMAIAGFIFCNSAHVSPASIAGDFCLRVPFSFEKDGSLGEIRFRRILRAFEKNLETITNPAVVTAPKPDAVEDEKIRQRAVLDLVKFLEAQPNNMFVTDKKSAAEAIIEYLMKQRGIGIEKLKKIQFSLGRGMLLGTDLILRNLTIKYPGGSVGLVIKNSTRTSSKQEMKDTILAAHMGLGPDIIYSEIKTYLAMIIEEILVPINHLNETQELLAGKAAAVRVHDNMFDEVFESFMFSGLYNLPAKMVVVKRGKDIDVRFTGWERTLGMHGNDRPKIIQEWIEAFIIKEINQPGAFEHPEFVLAGFISGIRTAALKKSQGNLDFHNDILNKAREELITGPYKWEMMELYRKADLIIKEMGRFSNSGTFRMVDLDGLGADIKMPRGAIQAFGMAAYTEIARLKSQGGVIPKEILIIDTKNLLPEGVNGYHFYYGGRLVIITSDESMEEVFHEKLEAQWIDRGRSSREAHILAAVQTGIFASGENDGAKLSPYHTKEAQRIARLPVLEVEKFLKADRSYQNSIISKYLGPEIAKAAIRYQKTFRETVRKFAEFAGIQQHRLAEKAILSGI